MSIFGQKNPNKETEIKKPSFRQWVQFLKVLNTKEKWAFFVSLFVFFSSLIFLSIFWIFFSALRKFKVPSVLTVAFMTLLAFGIMDRLTPRPHAASLLFMHRLFIFSATTATSGEGQESLYISCLYCFSYGQIFTWESLPGSFFLLFTSRPNM